MANCVRSLQAWEQCLTLQLIKYEYSTSDLKGYIGIAPFPLLDFTYASCCRVYTMIISSCFLILVQVWCLTKRRGTDWLSWLLAVKRHLLVQVAQPRIKGWWQLILILPVDQNVGACLVKLGSTCAPRQPPSFAAIHLKNLQKNRAAPLRPIALQRPTEPPNTSRVTLKNSQGTVQCFLSQYTQELASVKKTIWTCVPQKFVGKPLYT